MDRRLRAEFTTGREMPRLFPMALSSWLQFAARCVCVVLLSGCAGPKWVAVRDTPHNPLTDRLKLLSRGGPSPTERTLMFLRRYDLQADVHDNPGELVHKVQNVIDHDPSPEALAAAAELSYVGGAKSDMLVQSQQAFNLYCASVAYSYAYLFNPQFTEFTNPYDPQFRGACDLYNAGLEAALRKVNKQGKLKPGETFNVELKGQQYDIAIEPRNVQWPVSDVKRFEFVSDYKIDGLKNVFHTFGLGVPLIAVRKDHSPDDPVGKALCTWAMFPGDRFSALPAGRFRDARPQLRRQSTPSRGARALQSVGIDRNHRGRPPGSVGKQHYHAAGLFA